jgi:putative oxidoreductase
MMPLSVHQKEKLVQPLAAKPDAATMLSAERKKRMRFLEKLKPLALLLLRVVIGSIFVQQGYIKLFVSRAMFLKLFPSWGFPAYFAYLIGVLEFFGGILVILGVVTRLVGLIFAIEMGVAFAKVHLRHDWSDPHTAGLVLLLGAGSFVLAAVGAGALSVDGQSFERT